MREHEQFFNCPYCFEEISMLLDPSIQGEQQYVEDCQVCCKPIQITFEFVDYILTSFDAEKSDE